MQHFHWLWPLWSCAFSRHPRTPVVAETTILSKAGQPMQGLPVTYQWKHKTTAVKKTVTTDAKGVARASRDIGKATRNYSV